MTRILDVSPTPDNTTISPANGFQQSETGRMLTLACSQDGQVVYAGSFANLWVSQNGGQDWTQLTWPQPQPSQFGVPGSLGGWQVMDVAVSPTDSQTVLVITANDRSKNDRGIWRTTDGGNTWNRVHQFPGGEAVGQLAWAPQDGQLVFAAGGSALAVSRDGGAHFKNALSLGLGRGFQPITHVAVAPSVPSVPTPPAVYALGRQGLMFVSFDGGQNWIKDQGSVPQDSGGAVGNANSQAPSVLVVSPRSPLEVFLAVNANQVSVLRRGDYSQFATTHQSTWEPLVLPDLSDSSEFQDSGCVFLQTTQPGRGDLLFYGAQRPFVHVGPLDPASASDWVRLDPQERIHVDLHGVFLSPNFDAVIQDGRLQVSAGTVWVLSDGGIYASILGGDFQVVKYVNSLACVNIAGVAREGVGPALSLNTGDNDGFYSLNGGTNWASQDYGGGDNDCSYADPLAPNLMLVFTPRWDRSGSTDAEGPERGTITLYKNEEGGLPDLTDSSQRHIVPGPPRTAPLAQSGAIPATLGDTTPAWNARSDFALRGSRPIVLTKPGEPPAGDGDYVFVRFKTDRKAVVLRTQSLLDLESPDDWDLLTESSTTSAQMQVGNNFTKATPFVTLDGWVYFQGTDNRLLRVFNDGSNGMQIGTNTTDAAPFVTADGWVYFRGHGDDKLWKVFNDGSGLQQLGHNFTKSTPFVTSDGWVYFQGTDNRLLKVFNDGTGGTQIGGNSSDSAPFVTEDGWIFFRGHNDNKLWKVFKNGSGLMQIGNNFTNSTPFVTRDGWVYFQGTDNRLLKVFNDGNGGTQIGTNTTDSAPFVTDDGWVYFRGHGDDLLWRVFKDGSHLMSLGGNTTDSTPFVTPGGWVYFQGHGDNKLWKLFISTSQRRVAQQGPVLPSVDLGVLQASGGHTQTVFYVSGNAAQELWKWTEGMPNWERLVPRGNVTSARRFFVDPYRPNLIYVLDQEKVWRSEDGGHTWQADANLQQQLTCNKLIPIDRAPVDLADVVLQDMQFDPYLSLTRIAVGIGGVFLTNDGANWIRLMDTAALPGRPSNCYYDWVSNPCERNVYVGLSGRSVVRIGPLPWGSLQAPDPALWSPSVPLSGLQSKSTPAVAVFQGVMHLVRNDPQQNNALIWSTSSDGLNWSADQLLGPSTQSGASLAAFESTLHMVYLEDGSNVIRWWTFDGSSWTDQGAIQDMTIQPPHAPQNLSSPALPALVWFQNLIMVFSDPSSNELHMAIYNGTAWSAKISIRGQFSTRRAMLSVFGGALHMVYLADTDHVCWSVYIGSVFPNSGGGAWWSRTRIRCRKSQSVPALALHDGLLHMVQQGDGSDSILWSLYDGDEWTPDVTIMGQTSQTTLALCETPDQSRLVMLRVGDATDDIWFSAV
jgi:hypothetical protein